MIFRLSGDGQGKPALSDQLLTRVIHITEHIMSYPNRDSNPMMFRLKVIHFDFEIVI